MFSIPNALLLPDDQPPWLDATMPIRDGMVYWPDNAPVRVSKTLSMAAGAAANVTEIAMSAHTGTHVDAPLHFLAGGADVAALDLRTVIGPAQVVLIHDPRAITLTEIQDLTIQPGDRLLFKTRNSATDWSAEPFHEDFVRVEAAAAEHLRARGVICVGVDYLSVGPADTHRILLGAGITVLEGLRLLHIEPGRYQMICLPLPIVGADGAPARVLLQASLS